MPALVKWRQFLISLKTGRLGRWVFFFFNRVFHCQQHLFDTLLHKEVSRGSTLPHLWSKIPGPSKWWTSARCTISYPSQSTHFPGPIYCLLPHPNDQTVLYHQCRLTVVGSDISGSARLLRPKLDRLSLKGCGSHGCSPTQLIMAAAGVVQWATGEFWHPCRRILTVKVPTPNSWYGPTLLTELISYTLLPAACGLQPEHSCVLWPRRVPSILTPGLSPTWEGRDPPSVHIHRQPSLWELQVSSGRAVPCAPVGSPHPAHSLYGIQAQHILVLFWIKQNKKRNLVNGEDNYITSWCQNISAAFLPNDTSLFHTQVICCL